MHIKNKRGQSTVEYILLVTAVLAVLIVFFTNNNAGSFKAELGNTLGSSATQISDMSGRLVNSEAGTNAQGVTTPPYSINVTP